MPNIDAFKTQLVGGGARPNLFTVMMTSPKEGAVVDSVLASFMIKAASLPASTVSVIEMGYRGRKLKLHGDRTFEPWKITVINDTDMKLRNSFEVWMNSIHRHSMNVGAEEPGQYHADLTVQQLDHMSNAPVRTYNIIGAWPSSVSAIELNYDTNDTVEEFEVEFAYQYWLSDRIGF